MTGPQDWLEELRHDLGDSAVSRAMGKASGMRLYVPTPARLDGSVLRSVMGPAIASWLSERYSGETIDVPSRRAEGARTLREAIALRPDAPNNEFCNAFGVSHRRVQQIKAELRDEEEAEEPPLLRLSRNPSPDS